MAKEKNVMFDQTEVVIRYRNGGSSSSIHLPYDKIRRIQFDPCTERKFLKSIPSEKIEITAPFLGDNVVLYREKEAPFFDEYKEGFREFAKKNRITFADNTATGK